MTIAWPAVSVEPHRFEWWLESMTQEHRSPLTGATQTQELRGARWACRVEYYHLQEDDCRLMWAFHGQMRGRAGRVSVPHFGRPRPHGVGGGSPTVDGAGQTGATLNVASGPLSTSGWLVPGDFLGVNGRMHMVTATTNTDGTGDAAVAIAPPLGSSPANGAAVTLVLPTITMMLGSDRNGWTYEPGMAGRHTFIFDLVEVL
mgnify:CR=1 FL=1